MVSVIPPKFNPLETSRDGIYAVGPFREPKDIPKSVIEASGAAAAAAARFSPARFSLTTEKTYPEESEISDEAPNWGLCLPLRIQYWRFSGCT